MRHPKHKSLYLDEYTGRWELRITRKRSTSRCCVAWCKNLPVCKYKRGKIYHGPICHKCESRRYRANNPEKYAYESLKGSAKKRNIEFGISFEEFRDWCKRTGYADNKGKQRLTDHCDRIDDSRGYFLNNIQLLSEGDNVRKQRLREKQNKENQDPF